MAGNPALIVRVSATIDELRRVLAEGKGEITAAGQQMIASTVALQSRLVIAEAAARQAGSAQLALANEIAKAGDATEVQARQMAALSAQYLEAKGTVASIRDEIGAMAQATDGATGPTNNLRNSLGQFDALLASVGVNIGAEVRSLGELGEASGKTASQVGLLGTAGLVVGTAIGSWKIGRVISEFFELDKAIGDATAKLFGFGDVGAAEAAAKADVLAKASNLAGTEIKDMALAMAINEEAAKTSAAALAARTNETKSAAEAEKEAADAIHQANQRLLHDLQAELTATKGFRDAMTELNSVGQDFRATVDAIDGAVVEGIKFYLQAGVSQKVLAEAYGLTDTQVRAIAKSLQEEQAAQKQAAETTDAHAKAARDAAAALEAEAVASAKAKEAAQQKAAAEKKIADEKKAAMMAQGNTLDVAHAVRADPELAQLLAQGWSLENAEQILLAKRWNFVPKLYSPKGQPETSPDPSERVPGYASGVMNAPGGWALVGERGPEMMRVPRGADIYPSGSSAAINHITINVTQPLGTPMAIAAAVDAAIVARLKNTGFRF